MSNLFVRLAQCLRENEVKAKIKLTQQLYNDWQSGLLDMQRIAPIADISEVGQPAKPELVAPRLVSKRSINTEEGRLALGHALAHIEFNAVNLALDAAYRFENMPEKYYTDWLTVAYEEAYHFELLESYLSKRGITYGDYPAHNGLWEMAELTAYDVMVRMALVPRVLEARGLDVTPGIINKLTQAKDEEFIAHLEIIHRDEINHVAIGNHWYKYCCQQRNIDSRQTFIDLIHKYMKGNLRGPYDEVARKQAGFTEQEIADLKALKIS